MMGHLIMRNLVVGNWKMNGLQAARAEVRAMSAGARPDTVDVVLCPPATLLADVVRDLEGTPIGVGGQDCYTIAQGPFTGQVSAEMLFDAGARFVIIGHSEMRAEGERSDMARIKAMEALRAGLTPIVCVGENAQQRAEGWAAPRVRAQLLASLPHLGPGDHQRLVVGYEPVWAIGSGQTPTVEEIGSVHHVVRETLVELYGAEAGAGVRVLYGGSVKPENAKDIMAVDGVDGLLVGGASLTAASFLSVLEAAA